jgi:hypothetical protein
VFVRGGGDIASIYPVELYGNASFSGCAFKKTRKIRFIYLPQNENSMVKLENSTFELTGAEAGLQAIVLRNTRNGEDETTEGVEDRVFSDVPVEVGVQDLTRGDEDIYYEIGDIEDLTIVVGPNLEDAPDKYLLSGDDEAVLAYKAQLVRHLTPGMHHLGGARYLRSEKILIPISFMARVDH